MHIEKTYYIEGGAEISEDDIDFYFRNCRMGIVTKKVIHFNGGTAVRWNYAYHTKTTSAGMEVDYNVPIDQVAELLFGDDKSSKMLFLLQNMK